MNIILQHVFHFASQDNYSISFLSNLYVLEIWYFLISPDTCLCSMCVKFHLQYCYVFYSPQMKEQKSTLEMNESQQSSSKRQEPKAVHHSMDVQTDI